MIIEEYLSLEHCAFPTVLYPELHWNLLSPQCLHDIDLCGAVRREQGSIDCGNEDDPYGVDQR
jgi:hypothetical protein